MVAGWASFGIWPVGRVNPRQSGLSGRAGWVWQRARSRGLVGIDRDSQLLGCMMAGFVTGGGLKWIAVYYRDMRQPCLVGTHPTLTVNALVGSQVSLAVHRVTLGSSELWHASG